MESLEDRIALAALYVWTGADNATNLNASNRLNWLVGGAIPAQAPSSNDDLLFDNTGAGGFLYNCTVDAAFVGTVRNLTIRSTYTRIITLDSSLTVTGTTTIEGGTLSGGGIFWIGDHPPVGPPAPATFNWSGGDISGTPTSGLITNSNTTTTISGAADKLLTGRGLLDYGTINWTGGKIVLGGGG